MNTRWIFWALILAYLIDAHHGIAAALWAYGMVVEARSEVRP